MATSAGPQAAKMADPVYITTGAGPTSGKPSASPNNQEEDEDEEHMDVAFIQGFADKIQRIPVELLDGVERSRPKIIIPKRGEKDFEPLQETVNLQEMMLQKSRQALFDALEGVRGVSGKALSHAVVTPSSPYPQLLVSRGHVLDSLGITVRRTPPFGSSIKPVSRVELLPEEVLYLVERGTLQLWNGCDPQTEDEVAAGVGAWCDEEFGVKGAVEMSVLEAFGAFMGQDGLTWQRYQAYAYLKRLGYTVQRTRQFIPQHFLATTSPQAPAPRVDLLAVFRQLPQQVLQVLRQAWTTVTDVVFSLGSVGLGVLSSNGPFVGTTIQRWSGKTYSSLFAHLRFVPCGHDNPIPVVAPRSSTSIYAPLEQNPYIPFFHVWKPVTQWSKAKWDRGSPDGLTQQKPDYVVAVVESRNTAMPTLTQLDEVFRMLPDEPRGPTRRVGPQYEQKRRNVRPKTAVENSSSGAFKWLPSWLLRAKPAAPTPSGNALNSLRNGDRALIVAVNDSGNTGWVRFGRTGFENWAMM